MYSALIVHWWCTRDQSQAPLHSSKRFSAVLIQLLIATLCSWNTTRKRCFILPYVAGFLSTSIYLISPRDEGKCVKFFTMEEKSGNRLTCTRAFNQRNLSLHGSTLLRSLLIITLNKSERNKATQLLLTAHSSTHPNSLESGSNAETALSLAQSSPLIIPSRRI